MSRHTSEARELRPLLPVLLALILVLAFVAVGRWGSDANPDTAAVALPAWSLVMRGDIDLSGIRDPLPWVVEVGENLYSDRPPGLIASAIPAYLVVRPSESTNGPATATALILTLLSVFVVWRIVQPLTSTTFAAMTSMTYALGTTTWVISSAQLWPHAPGALLLSLAVLNLARGRRVLSGLAFGAEILVRPLTAVAAAVTGVLESVRERSMGPAIRIGLPSSVGLALLVTYNRLLFGSWSVTGGYPTTFTTGALERFTLWSYVQNVANMFVLPPNGLFLWTPVIAVSLFAAWRYRAMVPGWAMSAAWSGLAYLLVHAALNRASGGLQLLYRYPLEAIVLALPALAVGSFHLIRQGRLSTYLVVMTVAFSIAMQVVGATVITCASFGASAPICSLIG